jgi:hypothetical protein
VTGCGYPPARLHHAGKYLEQHWNFQISMPLFNVHNGTSLASIAVGFARWSFARHGV